MVVLDVNALFIKVRLNNKLQKLSTLCKAGCDPTTFMCRIVARVLSKFPEVTFSDALELKIVMGLRFRFLYCVLKVVMQDQNENVVDRIIGKMLGNTLRYTSLLKSEMELTKLSL